MAPKLKYLASDNNSTANFETPGLQNGHSFAADMILCQLPAALSPFWTCTS
jgi:hypothetical protein